jgi:hypothetical protein
MLCISHNVILLTSRPQNNASVNFPFCFRDRPDDGYVLQPKYVADFLGKKSGCVKTEYFVLLIVL